MFQQSLCWIRGLTEPIALGGSSRGHNEFRNANHPVLGGVRRVGFNNEVLPVRIRIRQQFKHFSIQLHQFRMRISDLFKPGTNFFRGGCADMHVAIMGSNKQNCCDRSHHGKFIHSYRIATEKGRNLGYPSLAQACVAPSIRRLRQEVVYFPAKYIDRCTAIVPSDWGSFST